MMQSYVDRSQPRLKVGEAPEFHLSYANPNIHSVRRNPVTPGFSFRYPVDC